jgi:hypothetical protein
MTYPQPLPFIRRLACAALLLLATGLRAAPVKFDIPAQSAPGALLAFSKQAAVEVLFSYDELRRVRSNAVVGEFEPEAALAALLKGTGFNATRDGNGKFLVAATTPGRVSGVVEETPGGKPLRGATVHLPAAGVAARTGRDGRYQISRVPAGSHSMVVVAEGKTPVRVVDLPVEAGQNTELRAVVLENAPDTQNLEEVLVNAGQLVLGTGLNSVPVTLDKVVVTPSRFGVGDLPELSAATLTHGDLQALPQVGEDLFRAISRLPGLAASDISAKFWVRGAPNDQVLTRLDGADLLEPFHMKDIDGALSIIDLETVSRLDLLTGGFTAEFGNRMAGVLSMETESFRRPGRHTTLGLSLTGARLTNRGTFNQGRANWLLSARSGYPDIALDMQGGDGEVKPRYYDLFAKAEFRLGADHTLAFHALLAKDDLKIREQFDPDYDNSYDSAQLWARWRGSWNERLRGEAVLSRATTTWSRSARSVPGAFLALSINDERELTVTTLRSDWSLLASNRLLWRGGFEAGRTEAQYGYHRFRDVPVNTGGNLALSRRRLDLDIDPDATTTALHGAVRAQAGARLTLEAGARFDRQDASGRDSKMFSPRLNAAWDLGGGATLRAAWGIYHQAQGLHQLDVGNGVTALAGPERAEHRVLGLEKRLRNGVSLRAEVYERLVTDPRARWENVSEPYDTLGEVNYDRVFLRPARGEARGVELIAERRGAHKLQWAANYAWAEANETINGAEVPRARDQRHTFSLDLNYRPNPRWLLSTAFTYHSGWPTTPDVVSVVTFPGGGLGTLRTIGATYSDRLPAYHRLDLRATRFFQLRDSTLRVFVDIFNAYNRANPYRYNASSRLVNGQAVVTRTQDDLFPILPSVGLIWDF